MTSHRRQGGYALIIMLVIVVLGSLYSLVSSLSKVTEAKLARAQGTSAALVQAKEALIAYAATYRDQHSTDVFGFLPCPDTAGDGTAGNCGTAATTVVGLLPYKTLGLEALRDSSGQCLWYIVSASFKNSNRDSSTNSSFIPVNWDTQGNIAILNSDGATVVTPNDANGGAAAVIIAAGPVLSGQTRTYDSTYQCGVASPGSNYAQYLEGYTLSGATASLPASATANSPLQIQQGVTDSGTNNNQVLAITPKQIFERIVARADFKNPSSSSPAGQLNTLLSEAKKALESRIWSDLTSMTSSSSTWTPSSSAPQHQSDYGIFTSKYVSDIPAITPLASYGADSNYDGYLDHWTDHMRYVVCKDLSLTTPCLNIGGTSCRAALLFGGQDVPGNPRISSTHQPTYTSASPATPTRSTYLGNYFESSASGSLDLLNSDSSMTFSGNASYSDSTKSADVGICLSSENFLSFAKDIGSFAAQNTGVTTVATVTPASSTITLGATSGSTSAGCVWYPTSVPLSTRLHAYFEFNIADRGEGFVFALADAATNGAPPTCGTASLNYQVSRMGYDGPNKPKIGLEIDTRNPGSQQTSTYSSGTVARNDPSSNHIAFVYWGSNANGNDDDNFHGAGTAGDSAQPLNPRDLSASPAGIATVKSSDPNLPYSGTLPTGTTIYVRLDISRIGGNSYTLKAYVSDTSSPGFCLSSDLKNLSQNLEAICTNTATIEQEDVAIGSASDLANVYVGFTNAVAPGTSNSSQSITFSNLLISGQ